MPSIPRFRANQGHCCGKDSGHGEKTNRSRNVRALLGGIAGSGYVTPRDTGFVVKMGERPERATCRDQDRVASDVVPFLDGSNPFVGCDHGQEMGS